MRKRIVIAIIIIGAILASFFVYKNYKVKKEEKIKAQQASEQAKQAAENACVPEIAPRETKEQCLERIKDFDTASLSKEVLRLKGVGDAYKNTNVETNVYGSLLMIKDFNCELMEGKNEQSNKTELDFVRQINFPDKVKNNFENWFKDVYSGTYKGEFPSLGTNLALGDLGKICPDELPKICNETLGVRRLGRESDSIEELCSGLCSKLEKFEKDINYFSETSTDKFSWLGSTKPYLYKSMAIYRFQGKAEAVQMCKTLPEDQSKDCQKNVYRLEPYKVGCENISDAVKEFVCDNTEK